jgi:hypothetical protein
MLASPDLYQKYLPNPPNPTSKDFRNERLLRRQRLRQRLSVKNQQNILNLELLTGKLNYDIIIASQQAPSIP